MKIIQRLSLMALAVAALAASGLAAHAQTATAPATQTDQARGDQPRSYKFADTGEDMPYRIYVPASWTPGKKLPLVLMLHGGGLDQNAPFDREPEGLKGQLFKLADTYGYILVAPLGYSKMGGYGNVMTVAPPSASPSTSAPASPPPGAPASAAAPAATPARPSPEEIARIGPLSEKDTLNVLEMVAAEYKVDRSKIFLMGNSMGSNGAMHLAAKYPDRWLAVAPSEGAMDASRFGDQLGKIKAKGVMIVKKDDTEALRASATELVRQIGAQGIDAQLVVVPNSKHESAWYIALPQIFAFFDKFAKKS